MGGSAQCLYVNDKSKSLANAYKSALEERGYSVDMDAAMYECNDDLPDPSFHHLKYSRQGVTGEFQIAAAEADDGYNPPSYSGIYVIHSGGHESPLSGQEIIAQDVDPAEITVF